MFARAVTWVKLRSRSSQTEFVVLNTHFPHQEHVHRARTESAKLIVRRLTEIAVGDCPIVVMADFNALPTSDAYQVFLQNGYQDTYHKNGYQADVNTFHGFQGDRFAAEGLRIDWILTKNGNQSFSLGSCTVITDARSPIFPSDHYPVLVELDLA
jgi:endonuclease/exonuclease/phosphatase family metal-dependent hydrolase